MCQWNYTAPPVRKTDLPSGSLLALYFVEGDFLDCFAAEVEVPVRRAAEEIVRFPRWARWLVVLRNVAIAPFGLSADGPAAADKLGVFPVEVESAEEIVAGFDDWNLDFRVSILSRDGCVSLATWVRPHNVAGRFYLALIMPFHVAIARNAVARVARMAQRDAIG